MVDSTNEKTHTSAPPYNVLEHSQSPGPMPIETINRGPANSPGPQMVMVANVPPPQQQQTTQLSLLREHPDFIFCPQAGKICATRPESKDSDKTWFAVIGICLICPCAACMPLKGCCGDGMLQDWGHYCTGCGKKVMHRPYNKEAQILAPDHNAGNQGGPNQGGYQGGQPLMQYQSPQPQH